MATKAAELVSAYGDVSSAPGRRSELEGIKTLATKTSSGITSATTVKEAEDAIYAIALADKAVTSTSIGRATRVEVVQGRILTLNTLVGGTLYTAGTYNGVSLTGGTGTGATANIVVGGGGAVTSVTIVNGGSGYDVGETLSAAAANIGGTGSGFSIKVATTSGPINA
jgi:hypothetical protein